MKKNYTLCDYKECPLKDSCSRYQDGLDRLSVLHFGKMPYDIKKGKCFYYEYYEIDVVDDVLNKIKKDGTQDN